MFSEQIRLGFLTKICKMVASWWLGRLLKELMFKLKLNDGELAMQRWGSGAKKAHRLEGKLGTNSKGKISLNRLKISKNPGGLEL